MKQILLVSFFMILGYFSIAQVTTGTISGKVTDNNGESLIAATIIATHLPSGSIYGTTTRDNGRFTLPNLRVGGPYVVEATYVGFETQKWENISINLGQNLTLNFTLAEYAVELQGVTVLGTANPILNNDRTGAATYVNEEQLQRLPTISRSAKDYYRLEPSSSGNSFAGRNDQYNNFSLDGSIFNNPYGLDAATPGGQTEAQPVSLDAIEQIQVSIAPYDVTQAGFTGAAINAVTKSGTNKFTGSAFGFYRNHKMTGKRVAGEDIFVPDLRQYQTGFNIGGPIIKNKVFFFANFEVDKRQDLGSNYVAKVAGENPINGSRVLESDLLAVSKGLKDRFGYETGPYQGYKHNTDNYKGIIKLDFALNKNHTLTATYNFLNAYKEKPAHPAAIDRRGPDYTTLQFQNSGYNINNIIHSGIVELKSMFGNTISNNLQAGYTWFNDFRDPASDPFPTINIFKDGSNYIVAGHEPFSIHNRLRQRVTQFTDNLKFYFSDHTVTLGASFEKFSFDNCFNLGWYNGVFGWDFDGDGFGDRDFNSVDEFLDSLDAGFLDGAVEAAKNTFNNLEEDDWNWYYLNVGQAAVYLQDEWNLFDNFKITAGLRVDKPLYFDTQDSIISKQNNSPDYNPDIEYYTPEGTAVKFKHEDLPKATPLFSPRVGFNWDVLRDNSLQVRGGSGLFTGRLPFVWLGNHVGNPNWWFYCFTDPDFKFPQIWRTNVGVDKKFEGGWIVSTDFIYSKDLNSMMVRNYGLNLPTGTLQGVDGRKIYSADDRAKVFGFLPVNAYVFTNTNIGSSFNATFQVQRNWSNGLYTSIGYNYLNAIDASSIEAEISSDAYDRNPALGHVNEAVASPSLYGNLHRVVGAISKKIEYGKMATTVSAFFEYVKGGRFTYTYSGDINNDGAFNNDLIYIPTDAEIDQMAFAEPTYEFEPSVAEQRVALKAYIGQDEYLNGRRGEYAEKYAILSPWYSDWDVRILQDFNVKEGQKVQLSIDVLNFGNLLSSKWGVRKYPNNKQAIGVAVDGDGNPTYRFDTNLKETFGNDVSLLSRWQMQIGLRYIF